MIFSVSQSSLAKALSIVSKGMSSNATLPILTGIHINAVDGMLELQSTDLAISIRCKIPAQIDAPGQTVLSGKTLLNIVKNLDGGSVHFNATSSSCVITCGSSTFNLIVLNPVDFPEFPEFVLERSVELPATLLSTMVDKVYRVTSKDTSRPVLSGVLMTVENNVIRLVATDSFRLAVCDTNVETSALNDGFEMIIPGTVFHDVLTIPSESEIILIGSTDSQVVFVFGDTTYVSRRIEGNFPNYKQLLPASNQTSVKLMSSELSGALRRVSTISANNPKVCMDVNTDDASIKLSTTSPDMGEASETLPVEAEGSSLSIALNYRYVEDCVSAAGSDAQLTLELQDAMRPAVFKTWGKINYLYLLMPVRM
ncbi:MAG: DNA polymerase III subunit beta [Atopobium sp.]|uniref:DNA polymerase III subunit beta n=1 Tax=Atopobium sp. TaxID=1872650 RepID=UPI002A838602|nr:DNA polymerase III subunit beta [Atopobium sp.]MDY4522644.1 DNA polymerase III subunit beta [Atopobium sp.]